MTQSSEPPTVQSAIFGIPLDILKTGGTVLILLAILAYVMQASTNKDQAYITLATSVSSQTTEIQALGGKVDTLEEQVTNMRIQFARAGLDVIPAPTVVPQGK